MNNLTRAKTIFVLSLFLVGGLLLLTRASLAQERYFDEAGYIVEGELLRFFDSHGGLQVFGYPISPAVDDKEYKFQYFQNGRLEMDSTGQIHLSLLPYELSLRRANAIPEDQAPVEGKYYPTTGHSVVRAFLDFYLEHGGPTLFGYPITELIHENDRLVQYFERAIFEWRPELPDGQRVQLRRIGEVYLQTDARDMASIYITQNDHPITRIDVSAAVRTPMVGKQDKEQAVYIHVYDQLGQPIESAEIEASILWPDTNQRIRLDPMQLTDEHGGVAYPFSISALADIAPLSVGDTIPIQIQATLDPHRDRTATAFRVWW